MIKRHLSILFLSCLLLPLHGESRFEQAQQLASEGQYRQAIPLYQDMLNQGALSFSLNYNLGNCYYRCGDYGQAILYYERAKRIDPKDADVLDNIALTRSKLVDKIESLPDIFYIRWWKQVYFLLSPDMWAIVALGLFAFTLFFTFRYLCVRGHHLKQRYFYLACVCVLLFGVGLLAGGSHRKELRRPYGVIMSRSVSVKQSPELRSKSVMTLHSGTKVEVLDRLDKYIQIKTGDGSQGWMSHSDLRMI